MSYRHVVPIRYGEVDMQRVVFNAHYLAYCDDAVDRWMRSVFDGSFESFGWDFMVKKAEITWAGGATIGEELTLDVGIDRWGTTSFGVSIAGAVGERPVFDALLTYVSVRPGTHEPMPTPDDVRARLA